MHCRIPAGLITHPMTPRLHEADRIDSGYWLGRVRYRRISAVRSKSPSRVRANPDLSIVDCTRAAPVRMSATAVDSTVRRLRVAVCPPERAVPHHIRHHRLYPLFRLITLIGPRRGEACALRWCGVDLQHGRWSSASNSSTTVASWPVDAELRSMSCDLGVFVYQPVEPIATSQVTLGWRRRRW